MKSLKSLFKARSWKPSHKARALGELIELTLTEMAWITNFLNMDAFKCACWWESELAFDRCKALTKGVNFPALVLGPPLWLCHQSPCPASHNWMGIRNLQGSHETKSCKQGILNYFLKVLYKEEKIIPWSGRKTSRKNGWTKRSCRRQATLQWNFFQ